MKYILVILLSISGLMIFADGNSESYTERINLNRVDELSIAISSGEMIVERSNREDLLLELKSYKRGPRLYIDKGNHTKVEVKKPPFFLYNFSHGEVRLKVTLPRDFDRELKLTSASGNIDIEDIDMDEIKISLSSGSLKARDITANSGDLHSSSGNLNLKNILIDNLEVTLSSGSMDLDGYRGEIEGRLSSGNAKIKMDRLVGNLNFRLSSGDFSLELMESNLDADLELKTSSGKIKVGYPTTIEESNYGRELVGVSGSGTYEIKVRNSSGDITID